MMQQRAILVSLLLFGCARLCRARLDRNEERARKRGHDVVPSPERLGGPVTLEPAGRDGVLKTYRAGGYLKALLPPTAHEHHASNLLVYHRGGDPYDYKLFCAWFSGVEGVGTVTIAVSYLERNSSVWSTPVTVAALDGYSLQNPIWLWDKESDTIHLMHTAQKGRFQGRAWGQVVRSRDGGATWSEPVVLFPEKGAFLRNQPIRGMHNEWLLPIYFTPHGFYNKKSQFSELRRSYDGGLTWMSKAMLAPKGMGLVQPAVVRIHNKPGTSSSTLISFFRSRLHDSIYRSESTNDGFNWTTPQPTVLPNNNKAVQAITLLSGAIAIVFNNNRGTWECDRDNICPNGKMYPISVGLSMDGGHTWPFVRDLQTLFDTRLDYTYPSIVQSMDGYIHISYSWSEFRRRAAIRYMRITEDWIRGSYKWGTTRGVYQPPSQ